MSAFVTGGGRGIGREIARRLAARGKVAIVSRTRKELFEACAEIRGAGGTCVYEPCDLADPEELGAVYGKLAAQVGPFDVLINNAGFVESAPVARTTLENWSRTLAVNLTAAFVLCKLALPAMLERKVGRIVNVASSAAKRGAAYIAAYAASKHGLLGLTTSLAEEVAGTGVTVNAVCPVYVETEMTRRNIERIREKTGRSEEEIRGRFGRILQPADVADAVMALVNSERNGEAVDL